MYYKWHHQKQRIYLFLQNTCHDFGMLEKNYKELVKIRAHKVGKRVKSDSYRGIILNFY